MTEMTSLAASPETTTADSSKITLIIVVCIGGVIIAASIIIIIVVAVFVRKSTRELKEQTRANQNRPRGPRPAHANSVRIAQGQRISVIRGQPETQVNPEQDQKDTEKAPRGQEEIQGFYALIPRSEDLGTSPEGQEDSCEKVIVYAALEFDDAAGKPGKPSEETGSRPLTGPCVVLPSSQPDTYVEMEPLVATIRNDLASVECYPAGGIYDLAKDPDAKVQASTGCFSSGQISTSVDPNTSVGAKNNEVGSKL